MALRRAQYAEIREIDQTSQLDSLAILEEVMRHFYWKARTRATGHLNRILQVSKLLPIVEALFPRRENLVPLEHSWPDFVEQRIRAPARRRADYG